MNLDHLRYFEVLANLEHYGKAAELLNITQPTLTYAISQLEAELGTSLFEKKGRRIYLTRYGDEFLKTVKSSLKILDNGTRSVIEEGKNGSSILIGSIRTLGTTLVPFLLRDFKSKRDDSVKFSLQSRNGFSGSILKAVEDGELDFGFTAIPGDPAIFETVSFKCSEFVVITPSNHPLAEKESITLKETIPYPQIFFSKQSGLRKSIDILFSTIDEFPIPAMETEEDAVIAGLVAAGFGIAVLPFDPLLESLPLRILKLFSPCPERTAFFSRLKGNALPQTAENFWQFCLKRLESIDSTLC